MLARSRQLPAILIVALSLSACGGGGSTTPHVSSTPSGNGNPIPTQTGSPGSGPASAYTCPTSDTVTSVARSGGSNVEVMRRFPQRAARSTQQKGGLLAVSYDRAALRASATSVGLHEQSLGANLVHTLDFPHLGVTMRVLSVPPASSARIATALRSLPGVRGVGPAGQQRFLTSVSAPYFTNDPYFTGFQQTVPVNGSTPAPTYKVGPYEESSEVPGQWGMHAIGLDYAYAYSQPNNGSGVQSGNALGSAAVKIAIIDTGADTGLGGGSDISPELQSKIAYQKCFITNGTSQSTSTFVTDQDGHGTDVSGIAAAASANGIGFTGSGGDSVIYSYRVAPTPDDSCVGQTPDDQCSVSTNDIASAINDAVANHVNVISMSLGGGNCTNGQDPASDEGAAVANAIAAGVVVVAASGNDAQPGGSAPVDAPACDTGVIAAGATSLADGMPNGDGNSNGTQANPIEYVASYSNSGSPGASPRNPAAWGIVAPGGDPSSADSNPNATSTDDLHWIENIYTSTPFDSKFGGPCAPDYPGTGAVECRVLIAGTSMAAPAVAGAAALILGVNPTYQSAAAMKTLLCSTADDIGDSREGCGRVNVYRAMATALHDPHPPT